MRYCRFGASQVSQVNYSDSDIYVERTGAVGGALDFGPRGSRFDSRHGRSLFWH